MSKTPTYCHHCDDWHAGAHVSIGVHQGDTAMSDPYYTPEGGAYQLGYERGKAEADTTLQRLRELEKKLRAEGSQRKVRAPGSKVTLSDLNAAYREASDAKLDVADELASILTGGKGAQP